MAIHSIYWASQVMLVVKSLSAKRLGFNSCIRKIPWSRKWFPTPIFLPGKSHGRRNLVTYSPWGCKESDKTERLSTITHITTFIRKLNKILEEIHRIQ